MSRTSADIAQLASLGDPPSLPASPVGAWRRARPLILVYAASLAVAVAIVVWSNPAPVGSTGFWLIVQSRFTSLATIALVAVAQAVATVMFHTVTANRILTPSILGFDALYVLSQTALVFVFGVSATKVEGVPKILVQSAVMVLFATVLYGWLFSGKRANLHLMLLIGVVLGIGFGSVSTFLQRMLTPSEFDVLSARLFGSVSKASPEYLPIAAVIVLGTAAFFWIRRRTYDVVSLGRDVSVGLGVNYRREVVVVLVLVSVLVATSATLVGPMTFFGFLVATLAYQFAVGERHAEILPLAAGIGLLTLLGATFILKHVFAASGLVTVIIEFTGGLLFLIVLLKKGMR